MLVRRIGGCLIALVALVLTLVAVPAPAHAAPVPQSFIVVLHDNVAHPSAVATKQARALGGRITHVYTSALKGYSAWLPVAAVTSLLHDHRVASVVPDGVMHAVTTETGATWGIDRIDQPQLPVDGQFHYTNTGAGVKAYVIDTGINFSHTDFGGRAVFGADKVSASQSCTSLVCLGGGTSSGGSTNGVDCNGHGTHVAGTIGGATYGVAKQVTLVAVRVLGCGGSGSTSDVIAGIDWVTADHQAGQPAVANMSLSGGTNTALDAAVNRAISDGVTFAVAAGNGNSLGLAANACNYSPSRVPAALTISATDNTDTKASWANVGNCVDWFAPGVNITSDWIGNNTATNTISGTSMASPHTAGVAALYLQANPTATPAAVRTALFALTTKGVVKSPGSTTNALLFTNF